MSLCFGIGIQTFTCEHALNLPLIFFLIRSKNTFDSFRLRQANSSAIFIEYYVILVLCVLGPSRDSSSDWRWDLAHSLRKAAIEENSVGVARSWVDRASPHCSEENFPPGHLHTTSIKYTCHPYIQYGISLPGNVTFIIVPQAATWGRQTKLI